MRVNVNVLNDTIRGRDGISPYIGENNHWYVWDPQTDSFVDTGVYAGQGPTITDCYVNPDYTITYYFGDGTSFTTPSIRGADGNKIVYWTEERKDILPEGYDEQGIHHSAAIGRVQLTPAKFPNGYPKAGDYIITKGGALLYCTRCDGVVWCYWECVANFNGSATSGDEFTVNRLYAMNYANLAGLTFREVEINGVKHVVLE